MNLERTEKRSFWLPLRCNYLLWKPERPPEDPLLIITLHGHAMTPEEMLRLTMLVAGEDHYIASLEGPYQLWVNESGDSRSRVAFHWSTSYEPVYSRRRHHDMILHVLEEVGVRAERVVLVGFSQSVSLNYRFLCTYPDAVRGAIAVCGGVPGDWEQESYLETRAAVLHIATREDQYYPPSVTERYPERLRARIPDTKFHLLEGGHRMPTAARPIVKEWLGRVFGRVA